MSHSEEIKNYILHLSDKELNDLIMYAKKGKESKSITIANLKDNPHITISSAASEKYKLYKSIIEAGGHIDTEDREWFEKIQQVIKLPVEKVSSVYDEMSYKDVYRYIIKKLEENSINNDISRILAPFLTDYVKKGRDTKALLFEGNPGCGKTFLAELISKILGKAFYKTSPAKTDKKHGLQGEGSTWKKPDMGAVFEGCIECGCSNPVILFDEVDKGTTSIEHTSFQDECLNIIDNDFMTVTDNYFLDSTLHLCYGVPIFAANDLSKLSEPFKDRCICIHIPDVEYELATRIILNYMKQLCQDEIVPVNYSESEITAAIKSLIDNGIISVRKMKDMIELSLNLAKSKYCRSNDDCIYISMSDYESAIKTIVKTHQTNKSIVVGYKCL